MPTHYILYAIPTPATIDFNTVRDAILSQKPTAARWDFTEACFKGAFFQDYKSFAPGITLVYIYAKDDSITPFGSLPEIEARTLEFLKTATAEFSTDTLTDSTTVVINIITPSFIHSL